MSELTLPYYVHPSAEIDASVKIGAGTRIWHQVQVREDAVIGAGCVISKDVYIDAGVVIGDRVKIQNGVSVYRGVVLDDDAFVGPHASFTNDLMPRAFATDWEVVPTYVHRGAAIGANATIVCGVTLGAYSMVAAGSTVTADVAPHALVIGSPARLVDYICRRGHRMKKAGYHDHDRLFVCVQCGEELRISYTLSSVDRAEHQELALSESRPALRHR